MDLEASCKQRTYLQNIQPDPPPRLPCDNCHESARCVMQNALCRELICAWLDGEQGRDCEFQSPDNYHGLEGVRA